MHWKAPFAGPSLYRGILLLQNKSWVSENGGRLGANGPEADESSGRLTQVFRRPIEAKLPMCPERTLDTFLARTIPSEGTPERQACPEIRRKDGLWRCCCPGGSPASWRHSCPPIESYPECSRCRGYRCTIGLSATALLDHGVEFMTHTLPGPLLSGLPTLRAAKCARSANIA